MENRRAGRLYVASVRRAVCCTRRGRAISAFRAKVCTRHGTADDRTQLYLCAALRGMCGSCGEMCAQCCAPACGVGVDANNLSLSSTTLPLSTAPYKSHSQNTVVGPPLQSAVPAATRLGSGVWAAMAMPNSL